MKKMKMFTFVVMFISILLFGVESAFAQASAATAEVRGQVTDQNGAAVTGATIPIPDAGKGTSRTANSSDDGNYVILALLPSIYNLRVEASGFAPTSLTGIKLDVGQVASIPIALGIASVGAEITVTAGSEAVEVERTQQSSVIGE
ncbi:MAG: carboxypeptidase-like regulatory domain-containing protein, partial [Pyrinomonadaceae bacterium]